MADDFNVANPTKENIEYAIKNLLFYVTAAASIEEYRDYKEHSDYYVEPYPSLQDHLEISLCFYGVVIPICLSVWIVLKIIQRKSK